MGVGKQARQGQAGFSLVECMIAMVIAVAGMLSVSALLTYGVGTQTLSANATLASAVARNKVEELRIIPRTAAARSPGGSLTASVADHFDLPGSGFIRRWVVEAGPAGTQKVTVAVIPVSAGVKLPKTEIQALLR